MKKIEEDVAPANCLTLGDVSGMGDAFFPGDNPNNGYDGERGSGDIPLGSGVSEPYKQIMTYDTFMKTKKPKKKKGEQKKFKTKIQSSDSPYYHKLESSPYYKDFVYDFKTYIKKSKEDI
ncbi:MAG: hypothetical protein NC548_44340 [Lachnospiraceae bacterium]|nr:hypothetical protein [Lachnospiraceae bacterium]